MRTLLFLLLASAAPAFAFDANGVKLGAGEADLRKAFPAIYCKALEWKSDAADRRCDDGRISFGGVQGRITFYLKRDAIQAFNLRFDTKELERMKTVLRGRYGAPLAEATEVISRKDRDDRQVFKMRWQRGGDHAILTAQLERKRAELEVSRGNFAEEIYRVR